MRVFYDQHAFVMQSYGGVSRYFRELIPLVAQDLPVDVFMGASINGYGLAGCEGPNLRIHGWKVPAIPRTGILRRSFSRLVKPCFTPSVAGTVYHPTYFGPGVERWTGAMVLTVHDLIYQRYPQFFSPRDAHPGYMNRCIPRADAIVAVSRTTADDLCRFFNIDPAKIHVIHHGLSLIQAGAAQSPLGRPYLLYVGDRGGYKHWQALRDAYERTPALHRNFELIAFGGGVLRADEQPKIGKLHHFRGGDHLLATCYRHATAYVSTSRYEGFGIPLLEAMQQGCPIVSVKCSARQEVAEGIAVWAAESSAEAVAEALLRHLGDSQGAVERVAAGRERVRAFTWEASARAHVDLYRRLSGN